MKVIDAVTSHQALSQLGNKQLPIQLSLDIAKNLKTLGEVAEKYYEKRNALVEELGEKAEGREGFQVKPENMEDFNKCVAILNNEEVKLELKHIPLGDFPDNFEVQPNMAVILDWMFTRVGQKPRKLKK